MQHALTWDQDGPVSFTLEWNDLKFVFGGDTYPIMWSERLIEYGRKFQAADDLGNSMSAAD